MECFRISKNGEHICVCLNGNNFSDALMMMGERETSKMATDVFFFQKNMRQMKQI